MIFGKRKRSIVRLLVVEDEPLVAFDTEYLLREQDYEIVATVDRVAHALTILNEASDIHLVLADLGLADGSGLEVARVAAEHGVPVMFVTGHCPPEAEGMAMGCLIKPYAPRDLLAAIRVIEDVSEGERPRKMPSGFRLFSHDLPGKADSAASG